MELEPELCRVGDALEIIVGKWNILLLNMAGALNRSYTQCMTGEQIIHCINDKK